MLGRRTAITLAGAATSLLLAGVRAKASTSLPPKIYGKSDAPVLVQEWFSLNCSHCAEFSKTIFPRIRKELIETGRIRYQFRNMPLNPIALEAAAIAATVSDQDYQKTIAALFATQDKWAFRTDADPTLQLERQATLAGMNLNAVRRAITNRDLMDAITEEARDGHFHYGVNRTPSFAFNKDFYAMQMTFSEFVGHVDRAASQQG
jgi:protein-disulfide isomerase